MPKTYDSNFAMEPPKDLPLSPKVKSLRKAYQESEEAHAKYVQENSRYRAVNVARVGQLRDNWQIPALEEAKRELTELEIAAVEAGKSLPDKDEFLAPVKAAIDEYDRTVPALKAVAAKAKEVYSDAVFSELKEMGLKEVQKTAKAREEWEKAWNAMVAAKATLELHASLFSWCVTAGGYDFYPTQGNSQGDNLEYWELTKDGRLTYEASLALGFNHTEAHLYSPVVVDGLIEPDPNPPAPVAEEWTVKHIPAQYYSKPVWDESVSHVGTIY
ncbi:hypothetical protein AB0L85_01050 [Streptomyces sp. NPDC052051]|uniref:hypothetical protein n=1 Tax=Streptomyces sp. NPDC052051 TaxID=3154649 RepID=UPI00342AA4FB